MSGQRVVKETARKCLVRFRNGRGEERHEGCGGMCYCVPAKGPAMGVPLSTTIFAGMDPVLRSKIQIPIVIFQGLQIACGGALIGVFRKWIATEEARRAQNGGPGVDAEMAEEGHGVSHVRQSVESKSK